MSNHDDQKAKSSHVNHSRILGHELGCAGHGFRASRCVFGLPDSYLDPQASVPMHMKFGHSRPSWGVKSMRLCQYDIGK